MDNDNTYQRDNLSSECVRFIDGILLLYKNKVELYLRKGWSVDTLEEIVQAITTIKELRIAEKKSEKRTFQARCTKCGKNNEPSKYYDKEAFRAYHEYEVRNKWEDYF